MRLNVTLLAVVGWLVYHEWRLRQVASQADVDQLTARVTAQDDLIVNTITPGIVDIVAEIKVLEGQGVDVTGLSAAVTKMETDLQTAISDLPTLTANVPPTTPDSP